MAQVPWYETDICGVAGIRRLSEAMPDESTFEQAPNVEHERYEKTESGWRLSLFVPLAEKGSLELYRAGADLVVRIGGFTRCLPLPNVLASAEVARAKLEDGLLTVEFDQEARDER